MEIEVLYFAAVRDLVGTDRERIALPPEAITVGHLAAHLASLHEPLRGRLGHVRLAVNEEFAARGDPRAPRRAALVEALYDDADPRVIRC